MCRVSSGLIPHRRATLKVPHERDVPREPGSHPAQAGYVEGIDSRCLVTTPGLIPHRRAMLKVARASLQGGLQVSHPAQAGYVEGTS